MYSFVTILSIIIKIQNLTIYMVNPFFILSYFQLKSCRRYIAVYKKNYRHLPRCVSVKEDIETLPKKFSLAWMTTYYFQL